MSGIIFDPNFLKTDKIANDDADWYEVSFENFDIRGLVYEENQVLLLGAFHGMEWMTTGIILKFFKKLCLHIKNNEKSSKLLELYKVLIN